VEIFRFGPGFRRSVPPAGSKGIGDQTIWADRRARITELAFSPRALIPPQTSPDLGIFIVVSGGGWVQVGDERSAINHGEAVELPPGVTHGAWTDGSHMRALLVEVPDDAIEGSPARRQDATTVTDLEPARGHLAEHGSRPEDHDPTEGEPW
jgi:quercetin dioxygenase-like cupin family protein